MSFLFKKKQTVHKNANEDVEEDGFVLVGETEDERNTLTPDKPEYHQDLPPAYQFSEGPQEPGSYSTTAGQTDSPLYENYGAKTCNQQQPSHSSKSASNGNSNPRTAQGQAAAAVSPKTTVQDIPFKLDESLACAFNYGSLTMDIGDDFSWTTTSQYDYDFTMERSVIRDSENI